MNVIQNDFFCLMNLKLSQRLYQPWNRKETKSKEWNEGRGRIKIYYASKIKRVKDTKTMDLSKKLNN